MNSSYHCNHFILHLLYPCCTCYISPLISHGTSSLLTELSAGAALLLSLLTPLLLLMFINWPTDFLSYLTQISVALITVGSLFAALVISLLAALGALSTSHLISHGTSSLLTELSAVALSFETLHGRRFLSEARV